MPRPYANDPRRPYKYAPSGVMGVVLIAFGTALLLGLASGIVWVVVSLLRVHVFR
jgi:hypothetical protein